MTHEELKNLRLSFKLQQWAMADKLGISLPLYSLYERGKRPMSKPVEKLSSILTQGRDK